ncbi:metallophosphoesterase [Nocardioides sp. CER19]|uniref:metallophosphoesterase family protein n=1 Tax=Nocardioides sp. CER19 TaxID=3038538 RepID=UPI00244CF3FF|nr:metallophosphoesterase [Nocardioides sp. CER19]MDH2413943.1 metallophosphoesterase [Nocardioides sp. CER19]
MTVIALAGDWHGNTAWAIARIRAVAERGVSTLLHLGDFGIWPGNSGAKFLRKVERTCAERDVALLVTPGNHEDWGRLTRLWENPRRRDPVSGDALPLYLTEHIAVLPRGYAWEIDGRRFVSLGGAPSVDFPGRTEGKSWWREERIQPADVERTIRNGAGADVMLAHDSPDEPWWTSQVEAIVRGGNGWSWTDEALAHAAVGRERMSEAFLGVKPRLLVHGHYHLAGEATVQIPGVDYEQRIWSLDCDGAAGNVRYLDLQSLTDPRWAR